MNNAENNALVRQTLEDTVAYYKNHQASILTESDLKCEIYARLRSIEQLGRLSPTANEEISGHSIHSEVKFFDRNDRLKLAPDICLFRPDAISIRHGLNGRIRLPSKGFHATGNPIMIELKFLRSRHLSEGALRDIRRDHDKWINDLTVGRNFHLFQFVLSKHPAHLPRVLQLSATFPRDDRHTFILGSL